MNTLRNAYMTMWCVIVLSISLAVCSDGNNWLNDGSVGDGDGDADGDPTGCVDRDGDGFGRNCDDGPDCDDEDSSRSTNCVVITVGNDDDDGGSGGETRPFAPDDGNSSGVSLTDDGDLTLQTHPEIEPAVWIANATENTVSRLDSDTGREIARYASAVPRGNNAPQWTDPCTMSAAGNVGNCPSRTAIDFRGDCWIANRAFWQQGSVTKVAAHIEDCIDRNGNGTIETSQDLNDNGTIELDSEEFLGNDDECILFTVDVGDMNGVPRALAIAPDASGISSGGNAWVGMNFERRFAEIDGNTGEIRRYVDVPLNPYGALASKYEGRVWMVNAGWQRELPDNTPGIAAIDFRTGEVTPRIEVEETNGCASSYGIAIDAEGRVWVGGRECEGAFRYNPHTDEWAGFLFPGVGRTRGLVADSDGYVWTAHSADCTAERCGRVTRFRGEDGSDREDYFLPEGSGTIGVDLDVNGQVWVVNRASNSASRIDPLTGGIEEFPTGEGPYTYSDFTGHSLLLQFPRGYYRDVVEACTDALWLTARWDADLPEDTFVEIRVRTANERIDLASSPWIGPFQSSPANLQEPPGPVSRGRFLEFEITLLTTNAFAVPRVSAIDVVYEDCPIS